MSSFLLHGTEPKSGGDIHEHKLASRLKHIRENKEQKDFLSKFDIHNSTCNSSEKNSTR
jgi:hypothetical protein